ncbi:hypothetical protein PHLCEN_2v9311 [Hermanssonia centrifuga]|uniref:Uncharacterized protein n=1 Tax=Hermanssonia centrifuga TaxID=98765 RepID=A0A2R6NR50_9APHY|nr:hypothetical protein PHLCEN_2v9311 [Hermanssonia centrifuga]
MLMVWDLSPSLNIPSHNSPASPSSDKAFTSRPQPTAYVITFPHPLSSVCGHPSTSKEFLVADTRGSIFLTDWRSDPEQHSWRNSSVIELVEPRALADAVCGLQTRWSGSVAWRRDSVDIIGAAYGSKFALWDLSKLQGGKPAITGSTFPEGGTKFRWSPTYSEYFAVTTNCPAKGAVIHVYNASYIQAQPTVFNIAPRPLYVRDFDFIAERGIPRIVAAVGREIITFYIGVES